MKFGRFPVDDAVDAILAHSLRLDDGTRLKKGTCLTGAEIERLRVCGIETVTVAKPEVGDVLEDEAAFQVAGSFNHSSLRHDGASTGRVNIFARTNGLLCVNRGAIDAVNAVDPGITLATLENHVEVNAGRMVATVKIIPYMVEAAQLDKVNAIGLADAIRVQPFSALKVGLVQSAVADTKTSVLDKTRRMLARRLELSGSKIVAEKRVEHTQDAFATAIAQLSSTCDMVILFGASAISDIGDVIPAAVEANGGRIIRFGMPVDPGNLLLIAELDGKPVIGAPGCARSPAENGFDWILQQLLAGIAPDAIHIAGMGVGGLLMETGMRPHPRLGKDKKKSAKTAAIILAAGQSRRMGDANKMSVDIKGKAMVRHVAEAAIASGVSQTLVVTGHEPDAVKVALSGLDIGFVHNPRFGEGLSQSLAAGISALDDNVTSAVILLGDMPFITSGMINQMLEAGGNSRSIVMATHMGKRGNPVLWPSRFFQALTQIEGDTGARHVIGMHAHEVVEVELGEAAALDLDTPEAVAAVLRSR